jgi:hypothetical protein
MPNRGSNYHRLDEQSEIVAQDVEYEESMTPVVARYQSDLGRPLTPIERAAVEHQEIVRALRETWHALLREESAEYSAKLERNLEKARKGLFHE